MTKADDAARWRTHLDKALESPGETIILASLDGKGGMVLQVGGTRPQDLVDVARSLLEQARDQLEQNGDLAERVEQAIESLPSPLDEGEG